MQHTGLFFPEPDNDSEAETILRQVEIANVLLGSSISRMRTKGIPVKHIIDRLEADGLIGIVREYIATSAEADEFETEMRVHNRS